MPRQQPEGPGESSRWEEPTPAQDVARGAVLSPTQVESWRERGLTLVDGLLPRPLLERARDDALELFPEAGSAMSEKVRDFGSGGRLQFPSIHDALNEITLHPRLLAAVAQLLDVEIRELRLTQSDLWPKYGREKASSSRYDNDDQRIHCDYPNHTLLHPPRWHEPEAVEILLYLSDVDDCGGPTAVVPRQGSNDPAYRYPIVDTPGVGGLEWLNDRESAEGYLEEHAPETARFRRDNLYPREIYARYRFGSFLLYRHDTWHRGTPLRPGSMRLAQNLTFRRAGSEWVSVLHPGWAWGMYRPGQKTERLVAACSIDQRCVLGFPAPGHPYWNRETVDAIRARYGPLGFDAKPYEQALSRE